MSGRKKNHATRGYRAFTFPSDPRVAERLGTAEHRHRQDSNSYGSKLSAGESSSATKTTTPLVETPQLVSAITRQQMNDQNTRSLNVALRHTPGVAAEQRGGVNAFDQFTLRGEKLQLTAQNLLNRKVVAGCYSTDTGCFWGAGRQVIAKFSWDF